MNLEKLKEKIYNTSYPLDDLLLEFRWIAKITKNKSFLTWINNELSGYEKETVPNYRILKNNILVVTASNGFRSLKTNMSIQTIVAKKQNEKDFIEDVSNIKVNYSLSEIQEVAKNEKQMKIIPEQAFSYMLNKQILGAETQDFYIPLQPSQFKKILFNVRIMLQDFIDDLEIIENWEDNKLTSKLINEIFNDNRNVTINNITNNKIDGNNNVINYGNDNKISLEYNDNIVKECLEIINKIQSKDSNIEDLKSEVIKIIKECEKEKISDKNTILKKISVSIIKLIGVSADFATSMPLFTKLLKPLMKYLEEEK